MKLDVSLLLAVVASSILSFSNSTLAQTVTTVWDNGASSNRVDMIFVGDGYQDFEIETTYASDVDATIQSFFNDQNPFPRYQNFYNVHRVNVISNESGADDPINNITVDTALDASYAWGGNVDRCLYFNTSKANTAVNNALAGTGIDIDMRLGAVNSAKYGGCGGQWAVWSAANGAALDVAVHEVGHSFASLADEYYTSGTTWTGGEFGQVNVTNDPANGKWDRWLGYVDPDSNIGVIDYYEGGRYHEFGVWRPSQNSMMRSLNRPFDAISRERFIEEMYEEVTPLDDFLAAGTYESGDTLWVDTVDPNVINVEWLVDGVSYGVLGETLDINSLGLGRGTYNIEAFAYDSILDHSFTGNSLDWWRLADTSLLEQSASWTVIVTVPEPSSMVVLGLLSLGAIARRRKA